MSNDVENALTQLRAEIHGTANDNLVCRLDEIIELVVLSEGKPDHLARAERLKLLARAFDILPSVIQLIDAIYR